MLLARGIGVDSYQLGVFLGVDVSAIKAKLAEYRDPVICSFEILCLWRQRVGRSESVKTFKQLIQALSYLERQDLVEFVRSGE